MLQLEVVVAVECEPMALQTQVAGVVGFVNVTVNGPQRMLAAEPETLSKKMAGYELTVVMTETQNCGCGVAVIVAVKQGLTYS